MTLQGPVHHWRFPIRTFSADAMEAENLYLTIGKDVHKNVHRAVGVEGAPYAAMEIGEQLELQYMFNFWSSGQRLEDAFRLLP